MEDFPGGCPELQSSFEQQLSGKYASLSTKLKEAADFVVANPIDVATRSLRALSKDANLSPATFSRMSTALGYDSYEDLRDVLRLGIEHRGNSFSHRVEALQQRHGSGDQEFLTEHLLECASNLQKLDTGIDRVMLETCVERLHAARNVLVVGALGSTGIAEYMTYMASFITDNWSMASRMGASLASGLVGMSDQDVMIVMTKPPFASNAINAAREAHDAGAFVIVITDTHTCPALVHASAHFIVPTDSQHFFSSYAATVVLCEVLVGMLAGRAGARAMDRIAEVELRNRRLSEIWAG
ncbi:MurR/RpiR family transcriptional regulator [Sulfitobacter sp. M57]|uniref:MurR/RpiR family transcriptional regulator n=1 Tax=unclassified Sulfitobacter TaxID=196795 RepID=UPI0023E1BA84|nr:MULTISPECIES: MurR/RpiR family transcriptional regulator [unclassified Sulfitobacter]MDF3414792.1 MurR/RpiR family transcriptional regulator [Sulfitobacter sp. KE5]MDF3422273.1 MurR/RpiR family transcriptional regulator [Sulfitobacter sp. KE43]MDF3433338.1 MurR/RpiR family transcriptional regulator [Sulfitobacter sp. KE42]MDF3458978.1 MurR/RpiR family transcriptional regulator [Sulfitobacter sp. S74]MDF3462877.1 MurR/RpiR family transcriptional regulator [Sulfitobacter sp. Ks18]